jgi:hypothetical protein
MSCEHLIGIEPVPPRALGCEECLRTKHFHRTGHPVVASFEPDERWAWCYVDQLELPVPEPFTVYLR